MRAPTGASAKSVRIVHRTDMKEAIVPNGFGVNLFALDFMGTRGATWCAIWGLRIHRSAAAQWHIGGEAHRPCARPRGRSHSRDITIPDVLLQAKLLQNPVVASPVLQVRYCKCLARSP
jgi:hypothetical protein